MNILIIHQYFLTKHGSGGSRFNEMARIWTENGNTITVISGMVNYATGKKESKYKGRFIYKENYLKHITVYRCHVSEEYNSNFLGRLWAYFSFVVTSVICGLFFVKGKFNAILATSPPLFVGITGVILTYFKKSNLVFEVRDLWPESAIDTGVLSNPILIHWAYNFERFVYRKATLINTVTPAFKNFLTEKKGVPNEKVIMIPNAADLSVVTNIEKEFNAAAFKKDLGYEDKFLIIYVGAHGVANQLIQIIDTAELLVNTNVLIVLIGEGMQKKMLKLEVSTRKLKNVQFMDAVPKRDVFKYILSADAGISVLKKCETFKTIYSNKTFDYMACKKPVLCAIDGISRQLVEDASCGLYIEPENPQDFKNKICYYLTNPLIAITHGKNGYNYAKKYFNREILAEKYITYIKKLCV